MKYSMTETKHIHKTSPKMAVIKTSFLNIMMSLSAFTLLACSSGGGNETPASSTPNTTTYTPNAERLLEEATNSYELYVEADFRFDHSHTTQIRILATNDTGQPLPYTRLNIYRIETSLIDETLTEWSDTYANKAHLIAGGLSNVKGEFIRLIEFPESDQTTPLLLIEVNAMGFENKAIVAIESERTIIKLGAI